MPVTFQVVGNLADYGNDDRAHIKVRATADPPHKIGDVAIHSNQPETVLTDEDGKCTLTLVSVPGVWYRIQTPYSNAMPTVNLAGYVPDVDDPTTGVPFPEGTVIDLKDVADENPTPGYEAVVFGGNATWAALPDKPTLADVATSGQYGDLTGTPTLGTAAATDATDYATAAQGAKADAALTPAAASAAYAPKANGIARLRHLNVYDAFFTGQNSVANPAIWLNTTHLNSTGLGQWAAFIAGATDEDGNRIITGTTPKVVWFGDSWMLDTATLTTAVTSLIPGATVVVSGVGGNTSAMLLARFGTDVPADADYVIFNEPGINDDAGADVAVATQLANLAELVRRIRALGAVPIYTGHVPLTDYPRTKDTNARFVRAIGDGVAFPASAASASFAAVSSVPNATSVGVGTNALRNATGGANAFFGQSSGMAVTTGANNTGLGSQVLANVTTTNGNSGLGQGALFTTTGGNNTAVGQLGGFSLTTGSNNTFIGKDAGYNPAGAGAANATTTGSGNTYIGYQSGGVAGSANAVAIGNAAKATGFNSLALGTATSATADGAVAIGRDNTNAAASATVANDFILGTAAHKVKIAGRLNVAPRTPASSADSQGAVGDITSDDNYVYAKTSTGWKRAALSAW